MRPLRPLHITLFTFLAILSLPAIAQDQAGPGKKACVVFTIRDFSVGSENKDYEQPITASVSAAFGVGGYSVIPPDKWNSEVQRRALDSRALLAEAMAESVAQAVSADLAVTGYFTVEDDRIYISLQCWDVAAGVLATGLQQTARFNLAFYSSLHDRVAEMLPQIRLTQRPAQIAVGAAPVKRQPPVADLTFVSPDEGMEVFLVDDTRIGAISEGKLVWKSGGLVQGSAFSVEKRKQGFHTSHETVRAGKEIRLSRLESEKQRALEVDWTLGQFLGLGATLRVYSSPDSTFLFVGNYLFAQPPLTAAGNPVFHYDTSLGVGAYLFFPPDFPVRFGVSAGAGSVVSVLTGPAGAAYADLYLDVFNWWLETRVLGPIIFLRQEWKFTTGYGSNLLGKQWMMVAGSIPPMTIGVVFRW